MVNTSHPHVLTLPSAFLLSMPRISQGFLVIKTEIITKKIRYISGYSVTHHLISDIWNNEL